ncbi:hypothetical protein RHMOL_Rhmol07G0124500 [Rhododendron molle]|uniref:Uncharacterized protein n=3 Tax=Rhododendron molle TaxID=49168 RepID=A0ACC0N115_RHOML|nr:hypothetical protein RHMOL_Rhmol07G0124500 [Rhododendron molle]KAI8546520.1 hypothetical protein RHMOL_Rhmol07G0124500 [Rhododendron molle]KAI8546521.1 hypothetical protein RHMOL_Rhmol07G0124500 [Rhododendron molle]
MANASGYFSPSIPSLRKRNNPPCIGIYQAGFTSAEGISKRVFCCSSSTIEGAEASPAGTRVPRLISKGCKLVGCGSAVPSLKVSNDDLANLVDTSDEWISSRTGIRNRRVLAGNESMTALAVEAARKALQMAEVDPDDVDLVLMCTSTPEDLFGSAPQIQKALGCKNNPLAYDITAACSGFLLGLVSAACYIRGGGFSNVLVIGADALTRYVNWTDRGTSTATTTTDPCRFIYRPSQFRVPLYVTWSWACNSEEDGLFGFDMHSDGDGQKNLNAPLCENEVDHALGSNGSVLGFPPRPSSFSCIEMKGNEVFRFAVRCVPQSIESALEKAGLTGSDIDWLLLHQANQRILDAVATRLEVPPERVISNLANYGNTSAASIPLALDEAVRGGKVKPGDTIATAGFGAGLTWASAIVRWG